MRSVALVGAGQTPYGDFPNLGLKELFAGAFSDMRTSVDRGLDPDRIEMAFIGGLSGGSGFQLGNFAASLMGHIGLPHVPSVHVENACASGGYALAQAVMAVASGQCQVALAGGVEKMNDVSSARARYWLGISGDTEYERLSGLTFAGVFGVMANRYMHEYGMTKRHLGMISVKNHDHGRLNPKAHLRSAVTLEQAERGIPVSWPLGLYDCCPMSDGAACTLVVDAAIAHQFTDAPVHLLGWGSANDHVAIHDRQSITTLPGSVMASHKAYAMAGVSPEQVNLAEVHDCFTISEVIAYSDLGFSPQAQVLADIESGAFRLGGRLPVNASGGLKAKGHPIGATGVGQAGEIFNQLRGQARSSERQVQGAKIGLTHNMGGSGAACTVFIFGQTGGGQA